MSSRMDVSSSNSTLFQSYEHSSPSKKRKCLKSLSDSSPSKTELKVDTVKKQLPFLPSFELPHGSIPFSLNSLCMTRLTDETIDDSFDISDNSMQVSQDIRAVSRTKRTVSRFKSPLSSPVNSSSTPTLGSKTPKKVKYAAFLSPKLPGNITKTNMHGDFHDVYTLSDDPTSIIKVLRNIKPKSPNEPPRIYTDNEKFFTIEETIKAIDKYADFSSPFFRFAILRNKETYISDGYYKYEFIDGRKATFADLKEFLKALVQDPKKFHIPDFKPDNVIIPNDGTLPVIIDPSSDDETNWHQADYQELIQEECDECPYKWQSRSIDLAVQLRQWYQNDDNIQQLFDEFDQLEFAIPGTKEFWKFVKKSVLQKIESNNQKKRLVVKTRINFN